MMKQIKTQIDTDVTQNSTDYLNIRSILENYQENHTKAYVQAVVSLETGIKDQSVLDKMYQIWLEDDETQLISPEWEATYFKATQVKTEDKEKGRTR